MGLSNKSVMKISSSERGRTAGCSGARIEIGQTKGGGCLQSLRWCAGLAPRAAREVDAENQNLDGHGL
jgi:hypothetical protein